MSRNQDNFVPMAGPVREIFEVLDAELWIDHADDCTDSAHCCVGAMGGLEEAAVAIAKKLGLT